MTRDVQHLLRRLDVPRFRYRDFHVSKRERPAPHRALTLAVTAVARGAGRTLIAANLADALGHKRLRVSVFSLDPESARPPPGRYAAVAFGAAPERRSIDVALLDLPLQSSAAPLADADEVVVVVRPGENIEVLEAALARLRPGWRRAPARYLVNQFDAVVAAHREELRSLRGRLGSRLLEPPVHFERGAEGLFPRESQAAADIAAIARTLLPELADAD
ncbi:MAG TPA: hypothetical protein VGH20_15475 [Myxococcales bacterium]|jgi:cellulose biosynthesis protein BcsQ